ncbi:MULTISPECIES: glycerol-3-phosphate 1-O-acyltransferase PlsY [Enterococcus]|uniref:Glycerol-3-phosphate acyltransferase n=1 Tax=Enterococcus malodoratus ATCC 43197 TaxID=1158601 RepID=R2PAP6_9ENTE|nr:MULTISPECIES: glycerol-3-phosphate 1-O-acyltransferase PlsY [Enterococcus]BBM18516.1 glycerol-3-phosphate acyltransferase [Enterococcus avium]EOH81357.1 acyl-phosphate glycerol 3-phosphate acyltransferase [Enterococcus malodoratus ATCC 43197]EOT68940.1 acyl-phosphate glycerol 3-phosphate acyltransferase [Enterococcus malodoratus ATCC 43197]SET47735.1 glycerol-3-phosphate acyltransferase PlsY [Enterococcus malodoratus]SPW86366.1 glycerol-3-phosphate acyltransferase [Enterococcus malodoratus]
MKTAILLVLAYLLGSIPSGIWIGKLFFKKDIREFGSGNSGTTNTFRVLGKTAGLVVFAMDLLKGTLATCLPLIFHLDINPLWFGLIAVIGHTLPIFAGFKGGKAVATSAGMLLGFAPLFFFYSLAFFLIVLYITSMVSAASIASAIFVTLSSIILPYIWPTILPTQNWLLTIVCLALTCYIIYRHKENIQRIKDGTENRVSFGLNKKEK